MAHVGRLIREEARARAREEAALRGASTHCKAGRHAACAGVIKIWGQPERACPCLHHDRERRRAAAERVQAEVKAKYQRITPENAAEALEYQARRLREEGATS